MARILINKSSGRSRITSVDVKKLLDRDRISISQSFSSDTGTYLVLKGAPTVIAEPDNNVFINTTGNPGMATAGTGDVLTGIIAGFLGQGLSPLDAAMIGTYMHGLAGDISVCDKGMHSLIATDIIEKLPDAFAHMKT
jgi:NAD(P)H-hydrate epimerase